MGKSDILKKLREERGWSRREAAQHLNVHQQTIYNWETKGKDHDEPSSRHEITICKVYGITPAELHGGVPPEHLTDARKIKIIGKAKAAGLLQIYKREQELIVPETTRLDNVVGVVCEGDSMFPLASDGNIILVNKKVTCHINAEGLRIKNGDLVYVCIKEQGCYFKRYFEINPKYYSNLTPFMKKRIEERKMKSLMIALEPINRAREHTAILCDESEIDECYKVVGVLF